MSNRSNKNLPIDLSTHGCYGVYDQNIHFQAKKVLLYKLAGEKSINARHFS